MIKILLPLAFLLGIGPISNGQDIESFFRFFPKKTIESGTYDSISYHRLFTLVKITDTVPAHVYNDIGLYHLLTQKLRPEIIYKEKRFKVKDIGRFVSGPHAEEVWSNGKADRKILFYKTIYPISISRNEQFTNVLILRRDAGYGFIELLSYDRTGKLLSGIFLVEGQLTFPLRMKWTKVSSKINTDGSITQFIEGLDYNIKRSLIQRKDGIFEIVKEEAY